MYNIGIDGPGCSCGGEGCSLCTAFELACETCGVTLTDANRGDEIGDLCATCLAAGQSTGGGLMATATFVRKLEGFRGDARLYAVEPEVSYGRDDKESTTGFVVVSAVDVLGTDETYIFAADEDGEVVDWIERAGSFKGAKDHGRALRGGGYEVRPLEADEDSDDGCGCSDEDGPCPRHEVDEEGPRGSEAADALRDSQAAAQRSR